MKITGKSWKLSQKIRKVLKTLSHNDSQRKMIDFRCCFRQRSLVLFILLWSAVFFAGVVDQAVLLPMVAWHSEEIAPVTIARSHAAGVSFSPSVCERASSNKFDQIYKRGKWGPPVHSLTSGLLPGYPEPENIYIQLSHFRQRRYLLPSSLRLRLLRWVFSYCLPFHLRHSRSSQNTIID